MGGLKGFTSAFIPTTLEQAPAAPRTKAPGSSSSFDMAFMSYSWEEERQQYHNPINYRSLLIMSNAIFSLKKTTLCFWTKGTRYGTPPTSVIRGFPHKPTVWGHMVQIRHTCTFIYRLLNQCFNPQSAKFNNYIKHISPSRTPVSHPLFRWGWHTNRLVYLTVNRHISSAGPYKRNVIMPALCVIMAIQSTCEHQS